MKNLIKVSTICLLVLMLGMGACKKKNDTEDLDNDTQVSQNHSAIESDLDQVTSQVDNLANNNNLKKAGPMVTIDSISTPRKMTIDYGTSTLCDDGKTRSGKIFVSWTGKFKEQGTIKTITFENFIQNGNAMDNSSIKTIENKGRNSQSKMFWVINASVKITLANGSLIEWTSNRTRTWVAGEETQSWTDDKYEITGSTTGVNRKGINYVCTITKALTVDLSCNKRRITAGQIELKPEGKLTRTINFGNGECDGTVTVSIAGKTYTITRI